MDPPVFRRNRPCAAPPVEPPRGRKRRWRAILPALALAGVPGAGAEPALAYPRDTVLLLVAPWCAPCHAELTRLDTIAAAARPHAVRVVLTEDNARARAMVRGVAEERRWTPPPTDARRYRADLLARAAGLPFSVATDGAGRICAGLGGGLDAARVAVLLARCRARE